MHLCNIVAVRRLHGSLLAANVFVARTGSFCQETHYFDSVCDCVAQHLDTKLQLVQQALLKLIPTLAAANAFKFTTYELQDRSGRPTFFVKNVAEYLLQAIERERIQSAAFACLG